MPSYIRLGLEITKSLISILVDDHTSTSGRYTDLISEFILKNEKSGIIQAGLNKIREGSILYLGINHNISEIGSITKPLTLYLGTEILFSLVGYNGEMYQQLANDFFDQVRIANAGSQEKITLHYFAEVKHEIDDFFHIAAEIVEGKKAHALDKAAMISITNGCSTSSDVAVKQSDFYYILQYSYGITEDPHKDYYDEAQFVSNLESFDYVDEADKKKKKENGIKFVSHINKLRSGEVFLSDIDSEHLMITNTKATLMISKEQVDIIKEDRGCDHIANFAISLDRITSLLWYKLGKGFGKDEYPVSVRAILKARVVLSSSIAKNADRAFSAIKKQYNEGTITEDQLAARIITLRNKPKLPEELQGDDIDEVMDFSPEFLSKYEERVKSDRKALQEKEKLIEDIKAESAQKISENEALIISQKGIIESQENENSKLRSELAAYHRRDDEKKQKIAIAKNILLLIWSIVWKLVLIAILTVIAVKCEIPVYIFTIVDAAGVFLTFRTAIKKDVEKYLRGKT